jgi:hypothetical protein
MLSSVHWFLLEIQFFELNEYSGHQLLIYFIAVKEFAPFCGHLFNLEMISFIVEKLFNFI